MDSAVVGCGKKGTCLAADRHGFNGLNGLGRLFFGVMFKKKNLPGGRQALNPPLWIADLSRYKLIFYRMWVKLHCFVAGMNLKC